MEVGQNNISNARNIKVTMIYSDLGTVKRLSRLMPHEDKVDFQRKYGHILDLLDISVEESVLSALTQFWKASLHCFELPNLDIMPTIEEYTAMIRLPIREKAGVYLYQGSYVAETKVAKLIGIPVDKIMIEERGTTRGLSKGFLESHLEILAQLKEWHSFKRTLALLIYGLVLFPFTPNIVDQASMDVFFRYCTYGANPIPAILADTFLSVEVCHRKKRGKLRCCLHMLYVWVMTHVRAGNHMGRLPDPLKNFHRIPIERQSAFAWMQEFSDIDPKTFKWVCPWYHGENIVYSCGNFPYVPLMGSRGCISYSPALVLRQLGWTQSKPQEGQLEGYSLLYQKDQDTKKQELEIKKAWENIEITGKDKLGKQRPTSSFEYEEWRRTRTRRNDVPRKALEPEKSIQDQTQSISRMNSYIEVLEAQMRFLEDKKQEAELQITLFQNQCQKKDEEIEKLKDEYANSLEANQARIDRRNASLVVKLQNSERLLLDLSREKEDLEKEVVFQSKIIRKLEMEVTKEKRVRIELEKIIDKEQQARKELESKVEGMLKILAQTEDACTRAWSSSNQYRHRFVTADEHRQFWKNEALNHVEELEERKKKHARMIYEIDQCGSEIVRGFEEAKEQINEAPLLNLPQGVIEFMKTCEGYARSFKKRKTQLLMY